MNKELVRSRIEQIGIIPAIRVASADDALFAVESISASGLPIAEITMTIPGALEVIEDLTQKDPDLILGAGTVTTLDMARRCVDAGARFLSSPNLKLEVVQFALERGVVIFPGALTPTEVMAAWEAGADFVKIFPCAAVGGADYIRTLRAPYPEIRLIASGGVNQQTVVDLIHAGASAVGIGRDLVSPEAIRRRQADWFDELTRRFLRTVAQARHPRDS